MLVAAGPVEAAGGDEVRLHADDRLDRPRRGPPCRSRKTPYMFPWSVIPTAGCPSATAVAMTSRPGPPRPASSTRCGDAGGRTNESTVPFDTPNAALHRLPAGLWRTTACNSRTYARGPGAASDRLTGQARPRPARSGTSISAAVSDPWAEMRPASRRQGRVDERHRARGRPARRRRPGGGWRASGRGRASPPPGAGRGRRPTPGRRSARSAASRRRRPAAAGGVEVAEPAVARAALDLVAERLEAEPPLGADVDLAVVGDDDEGRVARGARRGGRRPAGRRPAAPPRRSRRGGRARGRWRRPRRSRRTRAARPRRRAAGTAPRATRGSASRGTGCRAGAPR